MNKRFKRVLARFMSHIGFYFMPPQSQLAQGDFLHSSFYNYSFFFALMTAGKGIEADTILLLLECVAE
jgi:hypothetical protein